MNRRTLRLVLLGLFVAMTAIGAGLIGAALTEPVLGIGVALLVGGGFGWFHLQQSGN